MATKKQKQQLVDILKFTPIKVNLSLQGYGGESYAGTINRKIYDFFKQNKYDIEEYAGDWDGEWSDRIPDDLQPFPPGSAYECDGLWHASGAELSDLNKLCITDENGEEIWIHDLGHSNLEDSGVNVNESGGCELDDLPDNTVVYIGSQGEKGCFFDAEFLLKAPFDPKKLSVYYENCGGWYLITGVEYDGEDLDGYGGYSTSGKWSENKWVILSDEEVYEAVAIEGRDEGIDIPVLDGEEIQAQEEIDNWNPAKELDKIWDDQKTDWFDISVKPKHKGQYECQIDGSSWPFPTMCEWTGRNWKEGGKKVVGITRWRGLKFDPKEV